MPATRTTSDDPRAGSSLLFEAAALDTLVRTLRVDGYTVVAPTRQDGAIVYAAIDTASELPRGFGDEHEAGYYRLRSRPEGEYFGYVLSPQSWKRFLFPPKRQLFSARRSPDGHVAFVAAPPPTERLALLGVRACELEAITVQDSVFGDGSFVDADYVARRESALIVTVNCVRSAATCFCTSMGTGPRTRGGDLSLTEVVSNDRHHFIVHHANERGREALRNVSRRPATEEEIEQAHAHESRAEQQQRSMPAEGLATALREAPQHPHWDAVAERCLSCGNCTMVCPTCFCSTVEDVVDLTGTEAERVRRWDSCFNREFSYLHGGAVRGSVSARYRQWLTHKLSSWHEQFGTSGCVGCGRCITWCPVGIDLTETARALREPPKP